MECLRAETLEPTSLGSNSNCATSRLGELGWLASFLCASISSSEKWANSNCTSEGCCTNEASRCAQNTGYMDSINTSVLIIYREAEESPERAHLPTVTQVSPRGDMRTRAQTPSHHVYPVLYDGSNLSLLKCIHKTPLCSAWVLSPSGSCLFHVYW